MRDRILLVLYDERPIGWNRFYAGTHWHKRKREADRVHWAVRAALDPDTAELFTAPVDIIFTAYFDRQPLDPDNLNVKFYIDGLKGYFIEDDTLKFISSVTTRSRIDKVKPRVEIDIQPAV